MYCDMYIVAAHTMHGPEDCRLLMSIITPTYCARLMHIVYMAPPPRVVRQEGLWFWDLKQGRTSNNRSCSDQNASANVLLSAASTLSFL